ncbi:HAD-IIIA family hydrolase [Caulobacter sp. SLTY]|uniref:HAD-IIIA family hydrolase n=1 Tax=Caulobacter sp. SLTY TaxID=2683262 RepID=UPI001412EC7A|nr:HAD-IIIA family hydrolase [Caulobacter sp. SLTY]
MSGRRAIFLDRDGVLNAVVWRDGKPASPRSPLEWEAAIDAAPALAALREAGFLLLVVTNQPDVRRSLMSQATLDAIHDKLREQLSVDDLIACVHDDRDACACRKPRPGMLLTLAERWGVDLAESWMVGDQDRDIACGRAAGCRTLLLTRPYNSGAGADLHTDSLAEAAAAILTPLRQTA